METLGLSAKHHAYFKDLSGGQKQRLSIALALIGRPTIAVLDELTTGLDPQARRDTWDLVEAVRDRGVTIVLVTHDMEEAQHLCDRVALVDAGRVVAIDTPGRLAERAAGGKRVRFGSLPATNKPNPAFGGLTFFQVYLPVMIALSLALLALIGLPIPLTSYRELGVPRRMATTPVPPSWVLGAQVVVNLALLLVAALVVVLGGATVFGAHLPLQALGFVLSLILAAAAMFALGLWVAAVARTQRAAGAIGAGLFYPLLFFAGVWLPREAMPPTLRTVSDLTGMFRWE